jgi:hypothetical protein
MALQLNVLEPIRVPYRTGGLLNDDARPTEFRVQHRVLLGGLRPQDVRLPRAWLFPSESGLDAYSLRLLLEYVRHADWFMGNAQLARATRMSPTKIKAARKALLENGFLMPGRRRGAITRYQVDPRSSDDISSGKNPPAPSPRQSVPVELPDHFTAKEFWNEFSSKAQMYRLELFRPTMEDLGISRHLAEQHPKIVAREVMRLFWLLDHSRPLFDNPEHPVKLLAGSIEAIIREEWRSKDPFTELSKPRPFDKQPRGSKAKLRPPPVMDDD